jgi:hypothetical protein
VAEQQHTYIGYQTSQQELGTAWRWQCSCGRVGQWQYQSHTCCPFDHVRHVERFVEKRLHQAGIHSTRARRSGRRRPR